MHFHLLNFHTQAQLYMLESRIAFAAGGALLLLAVCLPLSLLTSRAAYRWVVRILTAVVVLCFILLLAINIFVKP
jgi:hypothetical protein